MYKNNEGYNDPTAGEAMSRMMKEYRQKQKDIWMRQYDMKNRRKIYVASPYAGDVQKNTDAAIEYSRFVIEQGKMPIASHLLYPQILNDNDPEERELGTMFGMSLLNICDELWVFGDHVSAGMAQEIDEANRLHIPIRYIREVDL